MRNSQVAHIWAQNNNTSAKTGNGNFSCSSGLLFSYSTVVGKFYGNIAVYTSHRYSATTTGKHLNAVHGALQGTENYQTAFKIKDLPDTWEEVKKVILDEKLQYFKNLSFYRKKNVSFDIARILDHALKTALFADDHDLQIDSINLDPLVAVQARLNTVSDQYLSWEQQAEYIFRPEFSDALEMIQALTGCDNLEEKFDREVERDKANADKKQKEREFYAKTQEEKAKEWRSGNFTGTVYGVPIMLRVNGDTLETSQGAQVPLSQAKQLFQAMHTGQDLQGARIGHFTVNRYDAETLVVGCHNIPMTEISALAQELGLIQ